MPVVRGVLAILLAGLTTPVLAASSATPAANPPLSAEAALGKQLFHDAGLSGSGRLSCASCHSPTHAYGPPNGLAAQPGGLHLDRQGTRAVPSLRYVLNRTPIWTHVQAATLAERLEDTDNAPIGGLTWDGRFNTLHEQALFPLFNADEMASPGPASVAARLAHAPYTARFRSVFGTQAFDTPDHAVTHAMQAIERYELEAPEFHPYTSKFDAWLDGKAQLSAQELHGKQLFDDPQSGNCASCHIDQPFVNGRHPLLTDYSFHAVGVPRNPELRQNDNPRYYDLGLCGPMRTDNRTHDVASYCGLFKTPSLRNAATRRVFFHNGRFHTLADALRFYVERDTNPEKWYPVDAHGHVDKFNDLPSRLRVNVDTKNVPLTAHQGDKPVWNAQDIRDVAAFIATLNDGYVPHRQ